MRCFRSVNGSFETPNGVAFAGDEAPDISSVVYVSHVIHCLTCLRFQFFSIFVTSFTNNTSQLPGRIRTRFDHSSEPWAVGQYLRALPPSSSFLSRVVTAAAQTLTRPISASVRVCESVTTTAASSVKSHVMRSRSHCACLAAMQLWVRRSCERGLAQSAQANIVALVF